MSTEFQLLGLEMNNIWLGKELYSRHEKEVIKKKDSETEDVSEQVNSFSTSSCEKEAKDCFMGTIFEKKSDILMEAMCVGETEGRLGKRRKHTQKQRLTEMEAEIYTKIKKYMRHRENNLEIQGAHGNQGSGRENQRGRETER